MGKDIGFFIEGKGKALCMYKRRKKVGIDFLLLFLFCHELDELRVIVCPFEDLLGDLFGRDEPGFFVEGSDYFVLCDVYCVR